MTKVALASTAMIGRDQNSRLEVLLLKRNKALDFAGGVWVFPGGKVDDHELVHSKNELEAAKIASVREAHEEANIIIDHNKLIFFRHWTTPVDEPRRFATYFFFVDTDFYNSDVQIDDGEIKDHLWLTPSEALDRMKARELNMMPPTIMSLQLISNCRSTKEARSFLREQKPLFVLPVLKMKNSCAICLYEGDAGYHSGNEDVKGARHRYTMDFRTGVNTFEYSNCDRDIIPVNGGFFLDRMNQ